MAARRVKTKPTPAELISRGRQASNELARTQEAADDVRQMLMEAIAKTTFEQAEARERLYLSIQLIEPILDMLRLAVNDGAAAEHSEQVSKIMGLERPN